MIYSQLDGDLLLDGAEKQYVLRMKDLAPEDKPREKLVKYGPAHLSVGELLAVVLGTGTKREGVLAMSQRIMKEYGSADIVNQKNPKKIEAMLGVPLVKACQIVACFELGRRFFEAPGTRKPIELRTASQVFDYVKDMRDLSKECLRGLYVDARYQVVHDEVISVGTLTSNIIHPREVFRPALEYSASAVILAHNHPSGIASPSDADIAITRQIVAAGKILGIGVLDHIVVTKQKFESVPVEY
ncbi:MAG: DNA repair protein RadC [Minisyncoccia bacterium]